MSATHLGDSLPFLKTLRDQATNKARRAGLPDHVVAYYEGEAKALRSAVSLMQRDMGLLRDGMVAVYLTDEQLEELLLLIDDEPVDEQILDTCAEALRHARKVRDRKANREEILCSN